jgi:high-affinity nickel-transport protein
MQIASPLGRKLVALYALLIGANLLAWGWASAASYGHAALLGTALLAYGLGLRHAVDADHIAAIDNVTRKLMQDGKRPVAVGFYFALGHSSVVIVVATAVAASATTLEARYPDLFAAGATIGTSVSAAFLFAIAAVNAVVLIGVYRLLQRVRRGGSYQSGEFDSLLARRGMLGWVLRRAFGLISRSWHMYPLGLLFALGFDTASEIGLLGIAASEAARGLPLWAILVLPALFTAGMSLVDTTDGVLMLGAYGWAFANPLRKLYYNLTITGISVIVALVVGGIEVAGVIGDKLGLTGGIWGVIGSVGDDFTVLGYVIIGIFAATWLTSFLIYRLASLEKVR